MAAHDPRAVQLTAQFQKGYCCQRAHRQVQTHTHTHTRRSTVIQSVLGVLGVLGAEVLFICRPAADAPADVTPNVHV